MGDSLEVVTSPWYMLELRALPRDNRDQIQRKLIAFAAKGWSAAMADQTVKHLQDGIYELRVLGHGPAFRLLFFVGARTKAAGDRAHHLCGQVAYAEAATAGCGDRARKRPARRLGGER